jgi:A/G-specific adenine glycosylase
MELGALVCVPRQPLCSKCPVAKFCLAKNPGRLPVKQARRKTVRLREQCAYIYKGGKVLLQQERARRWRGLWKLPLVSEAKGKPLVELEYPFTHHRITLTVFAQQAPKRIGEHQRWFDSVEEVAMPSPHLRAVRQLFSARNPSR